MIYTESRFTRTYSTSINLSFIQKNIISLLSLCAYILKYINFRFYYTVVRTLNKLFFKLENDIVIEIFRSRFISFDIRDFYWFRLLGSDYIYEPEINFYIKLVGVNDFIFVDLGANVGFWSLYCSGIENCKSIISVEPNPRIFDYLKKNMANYSRTSKLMNFALSSSEKNYVELNLPNDFEDIVGATVLPNKSFPNSVLVPGLSHTRFIEEIIIGNFIQPILIKLDIEGEELNFLKEVDKINIPTYIIYEDHGKDVSNEISSLLLERGWFIYFYKAGDLIQVKNIDEILIIKKRRNTGYNFITSKVPILYSNSSSRTL
jgi:FkbM family methyltransferase